MTKEIPPYLVFEGFYTPEQCAFLTEYLLENESYDPREFYGNLGLGGETELYQPMPFDPEGLIKNLATFAFNKFKETYEMEGTFSIHRSHANYMHEGAELHSHFDDRTPGDLIKNLNSKTYVCGLFLTDDYEGGELVFEEQKVSLKPKVGDVVLFPGFHTRHGVNKVIKGTRLNILTHYFDVKDTSIPYSPDYAINPER